MEVPSLSDKAGVKKPRLRGLAEEPAQDGARALGSTDTRLLTRVSQATRRLPGKYT